MRVHLILAAAMFVLGACGKSSEGTAVHSDAGQSDASSKDASPSDPALARCPDHKEPWFDPTHFRDANRERFAAEHPLALLQKGAGRVIEAPRIVGVFIGDDPLRDRTITFLETFGCRKGFRSAVREYGVGDAEYARTIDLAANALARLAQPSDLEAWIKDELERGTFGPLGRDDLLVFFMSSALPRFVEARRFHSEVSTRDGQAHPYAFVVSEPDSGGFFREYDRILDTGREMIGITTNPFPKTAPAWASIGPGVLADALQPDEWQGRTLEADELCEAHPYYDDEVEGDFEHEQDGDGYPFVVASAYSNARAALGLAPCREGGLFALLGGRSQAAITLVQGTEQVELDVFVEAFGNNIHRNAELYAVNESTNEVTHLATLTSKEPSSPPTAGAAISQLWQVPAFQAQDPQSSVFLKFKTYTPNFELAAQTVSVPVEIVPP